MGIPLENPEGSGNSRWIPPADPLGAARPNQHQNLFSTPPKFSPFPNLFFPDFGSLDVENSHPEVVFLIPIFLVFSPPFCRDFPLLYLWLYSTKNPSGGNFGSGFPKINKNPQILPKTHNRCSKKYIKSPNCLKLRGFWLWPESPPQGFPESPGIPHFPQISSSAVATKPKKLLFPPRTHSGQAECPGMPGLGEAF